MTDPLLDRDVLNDVLRVVAEEASRYLDELDSALVRPPVDEPAAELAGSLPTEGTGSPLGWLKELFGLPAAWSRVLTSGATMANVTCLAAARRWWGREHGVDVEEAGLSELPPIPVLAKRPRPRERTQGARTSRRRPQASPNVCRRRKRSARPRHAGRVIGW